MGTLASVIERSQSFIGTQFDRLLISSAKIHARISPATNEHDSTARMEQWMSFYLSDPFLSEPASFFTLPQRAPNVTILEERPFFDGRRRIYCYPSGYKVRNPAFEDFFDRFIYNKTAYIVHWSHAGSGGNRNTIVCCHGWSLGDPAQAERMFNIPRLYSLGLDVALFITPFHWRRAASRPERIAPPFPFRHPILGIEGFGQTVHDLSSCLLFLKERGAARIGLIGASLGGYIAALFVSLARLVELVALVVPLVRFEGLRVPLRPVIREPGRRASFREKLIRLWRIHSPLSYRCTLPASSCLIIASQGDRLCPFEDVLTLYEHWGRPNHLFLRGGHALFFPRSARGKAWYGFLQANRFI